MFRALSRLGALGAVLVAALAFSGSALANPTTPQLHPIPSTVFGSPLTISWSPSFWDAGSILRFYELQVIDLTAGTSSTQAVFTTSKTLNVSYNHTYGVRLRAANVAGRIPQVLRLGRGRLHRRPDAEDPALLRAALPVGSAALVPDLPADRDPLR